ncbi:hypothetical protein [Streptomyces sp. NPDC059928]|uniref:hypothetical protein n=1 Tax=unclassified Streptomyces TaxID=2593676 RepID=UPI003653CC56
MKVRVILTLDVDPALWKERYPLAIKRAGGVRGAVREYALIAIQISDAARCEAIRSVTIAPEKSREI